MIYINKKEIQLYKFDELSDDAKKNAKHLWIKYFHDYYSMQFVGGNVRAFFEENAKVLDFDLALKPEENQGMYIVSASSVIFYGKFLYMGCQIKLDAKIENDEFVYSLSFIDDCPNKADVMNKFSDLYHRIKEYSGRTFWWYYKWVSSGKIFEYYGFDLLKDGTPVKLSYELDEMPKVRRYKNNELSKNVLKDMQQNDQDQQ